MTLQVVLPDGVRMRVSTAITPADKSRGLSLIPYLTKDVCGMLFVWTTERVRPMTMRGCLIPLDIVWLDRDRTVVHVENAQPGDGVLHPQVNAMYVLEVGTGVCKERGVVVGSQLKF